MTLDTAAVVAFVVSCAATPLIRAFGRRAGVIDVPNERSSHQIPTPRAGGIAILAGSFVAAALSGGLAQPFWIVTAAATAAVALTGLVDDIRSLGAGLRFLAHCGAALVPIVFAALLLDSLALPGLPRFSLSAVVALPLTLFFVVGLTNAYNFMDGINGIASLEAIVAGVTFAILFLQQGDTTAATIAACTAAAAAGFLPWNFPSASIFMGDVGSGALGFLFGIMVLGYAAPRGEILPAILPLLPFILDTAVTLARRVARGERFYAAHRSHFYQRLNALGWSHAAVSIVWALLAAAGGVIAVRYSAMAPAERAAAVAALLVVHVALGLAITFVENRRSQPTS